MFKVGSRAFVLFDLVLVDLVALVVLVRDLVAVCVLFLFCFCCLVLLLRGLW